MSEATSTSTTYARYVIQARSSIEGNHQMQWEDLPAGRKPITDIYEAIAIREKFQQMFDGTKKHGELGDKLMIALGALYDACSAKLEVRIIKRTSIDEVMEEAHSFKLPTGKD